ncbi:unnamed protein product [Spirodela intermedia]|uniref:Uncharacterized protein n=1 Tax=Spirodela intermedia TaxID=51605 RepID=A0A7I8KE47_SPIIN|nr:unnamed protein product [Spirodela intermedia]
MRLSTLLRRAPQTSSSPLEAPAESRRRSPRWDLLSSRLFTADHLRQLLSAAVVGGLLCPDASSLPAGGWPVRNTGLSILNSMMKTVAGGQSPEHAVALYDAMRRVAVGPDDYTFTFALKAAARLGIPRRGEALHSLSLKLGFGTNAFVQNSLIHMYFACFAAAMARQVFDSIPHSVRDVISWNSVISGYVQNGHYREALHLFGEMAGSSVAPDATTFVNALNACGRSGSALTGRRIHAVAIASGFDLDFFLGSSLIDMYAKCGRTTDARALFDTMPQRNTVCWTSMISGYAHAGQFKASVELFWEMETARVKPDEAVVSSVISACGQLGALYHGRWVHAFCGTSGVGERLKVKNALIDMYSKCGDVERALQIFQDMLRPDVFSWTAIIGGLAMNGHSTMALDMFSQMEISGEVAPNGITFLAVLSACSHGGFVERGFHYFNKMISVHKISPTIRHYGCLVDLLGRGKLLREMESFIRKMPIRPDVVIWRSLLFACRNCGNVELAEAALQRVLELEHQKEHGAHVMLSNVYATAERWKEVNLVRKDMGNLGIIKKPGCSSIEINGTVHEFLVSESSHHHMDLIHETLLGLNELICSEGHICVPTA